MSNEVEEKTIETIEPKSIGDLLGKKFFIPSYQRGYRWTKQQVEDLLDDIWEFANKETNNNEWYSLQPLVVKNMVVKNTEPETKTWEVIDGQQRLTTIHIILSFLENKNLENKNTGKYTIEYETRKDSEEFLNNIKDKDSEVNIDFYHMYQAYQKIKAWLKVDTEKFKTKLLENVKFIWYESVDEDSVSVFTRLNVGKIPLTNAELIKALFLNSSNFKTSDSDNLRLKQLEIASEWDRIEYALQDDELWYFINKKANEMPTRIEFIFNIIAQIKDNNNGKSKNDEYATFRFFSEKFKEKDKIVNNWQEVKQVFQTIEEWFSNRELYHKVGYLIAVGVNIKDLLKESENKTKKNFIGYLNKEIKGKIEGVEIKEVEYGKHERELVRKILLLHNIQTMLNNKESNSRFPFNRYKKEHWDIEHIHAIATDVKVKKEDLPTWLKNNFVPKQESTNDESSAKDNLINDNLINELKEGKKLEEIKENDKPIEIGSFIERIIEYVLGSEPDNSLGNLCLLDKGTNRSYKNDAFKEKRRKLIEKEKQGTFIPICTKNIFMKYYSQDSISLELWNESDRNAYIEDIEEKLKFYRNIK